MQQPMLHIVDDDDAIRDALSLMGDVLGLEVVAYESAEAFLETYDPARTGPLILDLQLPGMSGLELQRELAVRGLHIPIIVISAHGDSYETETAIAAGADAVLEKPFDMLVLIGHIQKAIAGLGR